MSESFDIANTYNEDAKAAEASIEKTMEVPVGSVLVELSSNGYYGASKKFHMIPFSPEDITHLSLAENEDLPVRLAQLLQSSVVEKDENVLLYHKDEAVEYLIFLYMNFYNKKLTVPYKPTDDDRQFMKEHFFTEESEYQNWVNAVDSGKRKYEYEIDLTKLKYFEGTDKSKHYVTISKAGFKAKFGYPRYGDAVVLKRAVDEKFAQRDRQFESNYEVYKRYVEMDRRLKAGEKVNMQYIPKLPKSEVKKMKEYEAEKLDYITYLTKGLHLLEINGEDVSDKPLSERAAIMDSYRSAFGHAEFQNVANFFEKEVKVGVDHHLVVVNPVTSKPMEVDYPFRELDILAALKNISSEVDGVTYEVE